MLTQINANIVDFSKPTKISLLIRNLINGIFRFDKYFRINTSVFILSNSRGAKVTAL